MNLPYAWNIVEQEKHKIALMKCPAIDILGDLIYLDFIWRMLFINRLVLHSILWALIAQVP